MSGSPKFKVYRAGKYIAACKYAGDAAALCGLTGDGEVKYDHGRVIWREGREAVSAADSYDGAAEIMLERVDDMQRAGFRAAFGKEG